jgi:hypothetical protein
VQASGLLNVTRFRGNGGRITLAPALDLEPRAMRYKMFKNPMEKAHTL